LQTKCLNLPTDQRKKISLKIVSERLEQKAEDTFPLGLGDGQFYAWTDGLRRKDWHDYESIQKEAMRSGILGDKSCDKYYANVS